MFLSYSAGEKKQPQAFFIGLGAVQNMIHDISLLFYGQAIYFACSEDMFDHKAH